MAIPYRTVGNVRVAQMSPAELSRWADTAGLSHSTLDDDDSWYGGSVDHVRKVLRRGDHEALAQAQKLSMQVKQLLGTNTIPRSRIVPAVAGGAVCVPAALAGHPAAFRRTVPYEQPGGIRLYADMFVSCGYSPKQVRTRGLAVVALARALANRQPVELYVFNSFGSRGSTPAGIVCIHLGVNPVDWSAAAAVTSCPAIRRALFDATFEIRGAGDDGGPPMHGHKTLRTALGARDRDVVLQGAVSRCHDLRDPAAWVQQQYNAIVERMA